MQKSGDGPLMRISKKIGVFKFHLFVLSIFIPKTNIISSERSKTMAKDISSQNNNDKESFKKAHQFGNHK